MKHIFNNSRRYRITNSDPSLDLGLWTLDLGCDLGLGSSFSGHSGQRDAWDTWDIYEAELEVKAQW